MRPLRLMMDGFGSYRERTEVDFSDVNFFVLTGPTGAGKSTVIDALCFALYGTVPRWGKGNVIRNALAPSATACRVCLVFEAAGGRYAAARVLRRDARGNVHTKEARLDRLGDTVPLDAELEKILEDVVESQVEGPDQVTAAVTELLGIGYEHFTQCVLLPQGRFAEFLHAKPGERQDLLIELLAYAVYEQVGQRARERAKIAANGHAITQRRLDALGEVADEDVESARGRVATLDALVPKVDAAVEAIAALRERWTQANQRATEARDQVAALAALRTPDGVAELAERLAGADELAARRTAELDRAELAHTDAERACAGLPDLAQLTTWLDAHTRATALRAELAVQRERCAQADAAEAAAAQLHGAAETAVAEAESALAAAEHAHRAAAVAAELRVGEPCPVCRQPVASMPHHGEPADLGAARTAVKAARSEVTDLRKRLDTAGRQAAAAHSAADQLERRLAEAVGATEGAPSADEVAEALAARELADTQLRAATARARTARAQVNLAQRERESLRAAEQAAWSALRSARDGFVALQAPPVDGLNLAAAWRALLDWAGVRHVELASVAAGLDEQEASLRAQGRSAADELRALLADHGVGAGDDMKAAPAALAGALVGARRDLDDLLGRREQAAELAAEVARQRQEHEVAELLGQVLRSDGFERWLCAEALDSLVFEASQTLMQLSGAQYELDRGERNEIVVIDHNDAGTRRPVSTLSGGETFQASLSLALALSSQVVGLSAGRRSLDSMFLDEGFGTLDESTLDTVAATLEQLAGDSDRVVGVVTHVPALAERIPVQFAVTRDGASSRLRRL